jgi:hypothetical protein
MVIPGKGLIARCAPRDGSHPFALTEATQGSLNVSVRIGSGRKLCTSTAGGTVLTDHGHVVVGDVAPGGRRRGLFAVENAPQPALCELPTS